MNNSTSDAIYNDRPGEEETPRTYAFIIGFSFAVIVLLVSITYCYYIYNRCCAANADNRNYFRRRTTMIAAATGSQSTLPEGLDETTLEAYPKILFSRAKINHHDGGGGGGSVAASSCSICLQDYKDTDWLRLLPECGHFFHLNCVDPWLKLHPTCPICRNSPIPSPLEV